MTPERKVETISRMVAEKTEWRCVGRNNAKARFHTGLLAAGVAAGGTARG
jgi:hypothetical protein